MTDADLSATTNGKLVRRSSPSARRMNLLAGYALNTFLLGASGLVLIPALIFASGPLGWSFVAIGQSFGIIAAVFIGYGWALTGPATIAGMDIRLQVSEFRRSIIARCLIGIPSVAVGLLLLWLAFPDSLSVSAVSLLATALSGLSSNWFYVALARPYALLCTETLPRTVATVTASTLLYLGSDVLTALVLQCCGMVFSVLCALLFTAALRRSADGLLPEGNDSLGVVAIGESLREQSNGMLSSLVSVVYMSAPIMIVGFLAPAALPAFALADKIQKQFMSAVAPVVSVAQGWVPTGVGKPEVVRRSQKAFVGAGLLSIAACLGTGLVGPPLWTLLAGGQIEVNPALILSLSALCGAILWERLIGRACLVPLGGSGALVIASSVGSLVGVLSVVVLVSRLGASGGLIGVLVGLLITTGLEILSWRKLVRGRGRRRMVARRGT